ncbi:Putative myc-type, basic helix-loop-helix (bHLH) domain-containing protein [Septoria linicola]|uniref:Myc-type, basic helix-loop-helix (BHLH) domain-containing protein n=1 Tax=Septoria linicola TaxID=215465 RepID=A0A9Q9EFC6_9PEZI|nr:putative myc-type, basic helix-loop-helix (bHLH) domain-containing protein [Septoria linicola]USW47073.1 Putative myc-type, basic helix-loop-helix (bHLH) domain-containing protein [Septoria linicola]
MDASAEQAWSRPVEQLDPLTLNANLDDLGNLFEFGDIDLNNLGAVDTAQYDEHMQHVGTHPSTPYNELSEAQAISGTNAQDVGGHQHFCMPQNMEQGQQCQRYNASGPFSSDPAFQHAVQQGYHPSQQYQFQGMPGFSPTQHIPPTPNSYEMHGETRHFLQSQLDPQQRAILEQRYQLRKEDAIAFTPMVSPAGTPQYSVPPEFTIPGAYFSPLTSPMLHAQNSQQLQQQRQQGYYTNPSTAPSSSATSPLDPNTDVDMLLDESLMEAAETRTRKSTRRKVPTPRSAGPLARVKQSPIQKAIKRKSGTMLSTLAPPPESEGNLDLQRLRSAQPTSAGLQLPRSDSSANGSISPEPLSEALMGPPPRPSSSRTNSPAVRAQHGSGGPLGKAATPKSLLSMRRGGSSTSDPNPQQNTGDMELEDLQLPAAADESISKPVLSQIVTQMPPSGSGDDTPRLSARKTPKLGPLSTPSSARLPSAAPSPSVVGSPMIASTPGALLNGRKESRSGRGGKKRGSVSNVSSMPSPALRPKISPSIKPLLPEGAALHSPTHALLLASKSNYQNLLEGNQLPGVNYPESLSTGLTSKRTSHKVAEQGRRNRINEALKEMQSLLPKPAPGKGRENSNSEGSPEAVVEETKESKEDSLAKSNSSKAATVESANDYIRKLQKENAALLMLKQEHEEMKKALALHTKSESSAGSSASDEPKSASPEVVA